MSSDLSPARPPACRWACWPSRSPRAWPGASRPPASSTARGCSRTRPSARPKAELARIERAHGVTVTVETVDSLRGQAIDEVATRRAEQLGHKGIFVLIAKKEHKAEVLASPRALREELGMARLNAIRDAFTERVPQGPGRRRA